VGEEKGYPIKSPEVEQKRPYLLTSLPRLSKAIGLNFLFFY
jgi:hypothetical protein